LLSRLYEDLSANSFDENWAEIDSLQETSELKQQICNWRQNVINDSISAVFEIPEADDKLKQVYQKMKNHACVQMRTLREHNNRTQ